MSKPLPMQQILQDALTRAGISHTQQQATEICLVAQRMLTRHHALKHLPLKAASFREGVLTIHVEGSATSTDASMHIHTIRKMINNQLAHAPIRRIRFSTR